MIQKLIGMPKDEIQIILKLHQLHHQLNIDHDILVLQYIKWNDTLNVHL